LLSSVHDELLIRTRRIHIRFICDKTPHLESRAAKVQRKIFAAKDSAGAR